jgi:hypothetical protein
MPSSSRTADAVIKRAQPSSLTADAEVASRRFTVDAWVMGERWRHHRVRDHMGMESDLYVTLSEDVGKYAAYTPIHWVLADLVARITSLEDSNQHRASFVADAWVALSGTYGHGVLRADSVIRRTGMAGSLLANAVITRGSSFAADAVILAGFRADAFIV